MKQFFLGCLVMLTIVTLVAGKNHWDKQVNSVLASNHNDSEKVEEASQTSKNDDAGQTEEAAAEKADPDRLLKLDKLHGLPADLRPLFKEKIEKNQSVNILIMGSASSPEKDGAWPKLVKKKLVDTFGESLMKINIKGISGKTSQQVIKEGLHKDLVQMKPDILLLEPFLLYDNGDIIMSERIENLSIILDDFKKHNPNIKTILQPSNPIYGAHYYLQEEQELESFANKNKYTYLNHWGAWPDSSSEEIKKFLTSDNLPNDDGHKAWAEYITQYFIKE